MRANRLLVGLVLLGSLLPAPTSDAADAPTPTPRPNVVVILADDMGFSDLGCYGGEIRTPSIDDLAAQGVRFTQFYNNARCCPTRASLLTGLYPHQAGMGAMNQDFGKPAYQGELNNQCVTIAEVLRDAGYHTAMAGKWHLSHLTISPGGAKAKRLVNHEEEEPISPSTANWPINRGFEEHWGTIPGVNSYFDPYGLVHNDRPIRAEGGNFYYTDFITKHAVEFIEDFTRADQPEKKPFFLYVAYTAPHWPMQAGSESDVKRYETLYAQGWDKVREGRLKRQVEMGLVDASQALSPRPPSKRFDEGASKISAWEDASDKEWQARRMSVYAAMVEEMDRGVGKILDTLKARGAERDTVVVFLSDNGACAENVRQEWYDVTTKARNGRPVKVGNNPAVMPGPEDVYQSYGPAWANVSNTPFRRFKHFTDEGGISAPFVVRWPGGNFKPGRIERSAVAHVVDLMPTVMALGGASYPKERNGKAILPPEGANLLPTLGGSGAIDRSGKSGGALFWEHEGNRAVRLGDWKLVAAERESWQLYNVVSDRAELNDLAGSEPNRVKDLLARYDAWAKRCGVEAWPVRR